MSNQQLQRPKRSWLAGAAFALALFAGGFFSGGAFSLHAIHSRMNEYIHHPEKCPERMARHLKRSLGLNDQETLQVQSILQTHQKNIMAMFDQVRPGLDREFEATQTEVGAVLTPAQAAKWDKHFARLRVRWTPPMLQRSK